jgi:hypothetical protein
VVPVANGGASTAQNLRLLCRTHNQHEAERMYGSGFMNAKRNSSQRRTDADSVDIRHSMSDAERAVAAARTVSLPTTSP